MKDFEIHLNNLNTQQRKAVETLEGPVLVIAGPGTGKTQVLALRIANIIKTTDAAPSNILCLTFTESGVSAMRNRLIQLIGKEGYQVRIHTFHSFCNEVIQSFPEKFSFAKELIQLDDLNRLKIIQAVVDELDTEKKYQLRPLHDKFFYQKDILNSIQTLKREGIRAEDLAEVSQRQITNYESSKDLNKRTGKPTAKWASELKAAQKNLELAEIYKSYNTKLIESGYYDYEDMILFVIQKLQEDDELLAYYQEKFLYILVDEYQDTNGAQNELLKILGSFDASPNIFAVGDDDQAIYRFQGANVENLLFFEKQFENVQVIPITTNYRSSQLILDLASSAIKSNKARLVNLLPNLSKDLTAGSKHPNNKAEICAFSNYDIENKYIVKKIQELASQGVNYSDIAIFYRKHSDADDIVEALLRANIPIKLAASKNSLDELIVQKFLNLLKVIQHSDEDINFLLFQVLFYDFLDLNRLDVFKLINLCNLRRASIFNLMLDLEALQDAGLSQPEKLNNLANKIIEWREDASNLTLSQFIEKVADDSGFLSSVFKNEADIEDVNSLNSFYSYVRNLNKQNKKITLQEFLEDITLIEKNKIDISEKEIDIKKEGVNLMTAHKSKGLEFKYVFISKFYDGNWGGRKVRSAIKIPFEEFSLVKDVLVDSSIDFDEEDERRLFYVALTRAKEQIYITYSKTYPSGNSTKEVSVSQFLFELNRDLIELKDTSDFEKEDVDYIKQSLTPSRLASPYSVSEEQYLKTVVNDFKLSASALNDYIECPLKFKFNWLFKVPKPIQQSAILGSAIHYSFENYFRALKKGDVKDLDFLIAILKSYLAKQLLGKEDLNRSITEGIKLLTDYYNFYSATFIAPAEVEYAFRDKNILMEIPSEEPITLKGKLDKIDWLDNSSEAIRTNFDVRITDYKVMTPKSQNDIKGLTKNGTGAIFRQLMFYKILAEADPFFKLNVVSPKYNVKEVCVDFIKPNNRGAFKRESFVISDEELSGMKEVIVDIVKRIRNLEFSGSEKYPLCGKCEYCKIL